MLRLRVSLVSFLCTMFLALSALFLALNPTFVDACGASDIGTVEIILAPGVTAQATINNGNGPLPTPEPTGGTNRSISLSNNSLAQAATITCTSGHHYKVMINPSQTPAGARYRCPSPPARDAYGNTPTRIIIYVTNPGGVAGMAQLEFPINLTGGSVTTSCAAGANLGNELGKNAFTNGTAQTLRRTGGPGVNERLDALAAAYATRNPATIRAAASAVVSEGLSDVYTAFNTDLPTDRTAARTALTDAQSRLLALQNLATNERIDTVQSVPVSEYVTEARGRIAADLARFSGDVARIAPMPIPGDTEADRLAREEAARRAAAEAAKKRPPAPVAVAPAPAADPEEAARRAEAARIAAEAERRRVAAAARPAPAPDPGGATRRALEDERRRLDADRRSLEDALARARITPTYDTSGRTEQCRALEQACLLRRDSTCQLFAQQCSGSTAPTNQFEQLFQNIQKLFGGAAQTGTPAQNAACNYSYPGAQFINGTCNCPQGQQFANGSCTTVQPCAKYPGTQLVNNQCACPQGQNWTGQQCTTPTPAQPVALVRAELTCAPQIIDEGENPVAVSWACQNADTSRGEGFSTANEPSGATEVPAKAPEGTQLLRLRLACSKGAQGATAECVVGINRPQIISTVSPTEVERGRPVIIGWLGKGMKRSDDACEIRSDTHPEFSHKGRMTALRSPAINEGTTFTITCTTLGGNEMTKEIKVQVKEALPQVIQL